MKPAAHDSQNALKAVAWETTLSCPMDCRHCRGSAGRGKSSENDLSFEEGTKLLKSLASFAKPLLILTGGEPMSRPDIYDLASCARSLGLQVVMAPCGALLDKKSAAKLKSSGVQAVSISVDGPDASSHDAFRNVTGAFAIALNAMRTAKDAGLRVQLNCTVSKLNWKQLGAMHELALREGASTIDFFFLVPTGRGKGMKELALEADDYEKCLDSIYIMSMSSPISVKTTCAPQYARLQRQRAGEAFASIPPMAMARGCLAGKGFLFISHSGSVQPCGFLKANCGELRERNYDLEAICRESEALRKLGEKGSLSGACGSCEYSWSCGGCRARAFEESGDYLASESQCIYAKGGS